MSNRVRLIGGSYSGETYTTDAPIIRLPSMENIDFAPPIGPADYIDAKIETYRVEELRFVSGHSHRYGVLEPMRLVDAMNAMWDAYVESIASGDTKP